jgi:peptidoglycan/xylan/chitin deacetylase (PgdA/CDA1 family)
MQQLRIFTYHNIGMPPAGARLSKLYVGAGQFDRQCRLLTRLGIRGVSMTEGLQALRAGESNKAVVLSFDDGYTDNLTNAAPILQRYGFHATCYVVAGSIGGHNAWDSEILSVEKPVMDEVAIGQWLDAGHEIGSHTMTHPQLSKLDRERAAYEISESRRQLQRVTGTAVEHFCYPFGDHDEQTVELVREAGYLSAVTTRRGPAVPTSDPLRLPRITVNRGRSLLKFGLHAATPYAWLRRH